MFPTRNTFIHFSVPSHDTRSRSAPPTVTPTSTPTRPQLQIKRRTRRRQQKEKTNDDDDDDDDDILTLEEFARKSIRENWTLWAKKLCYQSRQEAKCEIDVMRLHLTLPWHLFNDWAFHTFLVFNRPEALPQLFRTGQLRHCEGGVQFWFSRRQLREQGNPSLRVICENAAKLLRAQSEGFFAVVFNRDVIVYHSWEPSTRIGSIVTKTLNIVNSSEEVIVKHRSRILEQGTLSELGIQPGHVIAMDLLALRE